MGLAYFEGAVCGKRGDLCGVNSYLTELLAHSIPASMRRIGVSSLIG